MPIDRHRISFRGTRRHLLCVPPKLMENTERNIAIQRLTTIHMLSRTAPFPQTQPHKIWTPAGGPRSPQKGRLKNTKSPKTQLRNKAHRTEIHPPCQTGRRRQFFPVGRSSPVVKPVPPDTKFSVGVPFVPHRTPTHTSGSKRFGATIL